MAEHSQFPDIDDELASRILALFRERDEAQSLEPTTALATAAWVLAYVINVSTETQENADVVMQFTYTYITKILPLIRERIEQTRTTN